MENSRLSGGETLAQSDCIVLKLGQIKHSKDSVNQQQATVPSLQRDHGDRDEVV